MLNGHFVHSKFRGLLRVMVPLGLLSVCLWSLYVAHIPAHYMVLWKNVQPWVGIIAWLSGAWLVDALVRSIVLDGILPATLGRAVPDILKTFVTILIGFSVVICIVSVVFHKSVTGLWATSGVAGIVIGIAARPLVADVFAGLTSNLEGAFRIGDWVTIDVGTFSKNTYIGRIEEIRWRTVRLKGRDGNSLIVPNGLMASAVLTNYSTPVPQARVVLPIILVSVIPAARARRLLLGAVSQIVDTDCGPLAEPAPEVNILKMESGMVHYGVGYWADTEKQELMRVQDAVYGAVNTVLLKAGIEGGKDREMDVNALAYKMRFLREIAIFKSLTDAELEGICRDITGVLYLKGRRLVNEGDVGSSMFVVVEGLVGVSCMRNQAVVHLGRLGIGEFFGEMSLVTGASRSASVTARVDTLVYEITQAQLRPILEQNPLVAEALSRAIVERQLQNTQTLADSEVKRAVDPHMEDHILQLLSRVRKFFNL